MADSHAHALPQLDAESAPLPPYRSPAWLRGGHAQTIWPYMLPRPAVPFRRERIDTPDGDFWDFDWLDAPDASRAPLVALFHGLEGNSDSHYARALMALLAKRGWGGVVVHYRGCSGELNRLPRAYHSGDHADFELQIAAIRERIAATTPLYVVGVSVGGSVLINWLGRKKAEASRTIAAAAAVSTPLDLEASGIAIAKGANRIYTRNFLNTLKPKSRAMARRFPGLLDDSRIRRARTLRDFDDAVTSLLHGFVDATDYWRRASSKPWLAQIAVPTLVVNAKNDPFVPRETLPRADEVSRDVVLLQPEHGGHAGFLTGAFPGRLDWLPRRLLDFFLHRR